MRAYRRKGGERSEDETDLCPVTPAPAAPLLDPISILHISCIHHVRYTECVYCGLLWCYHKMM